MLYRRIKDISCVNVNFMTLNSVFNIHLDVYDERLKTGLQVNKNERSKYPYYCQNDQMMLMEHVVQLRIKCYILF